VHPDAAGTEEDWHAGSRGNPSPPAQRNSLYSELRIHYRSRRPIMTCIIQALVYTSRFLCGGRQGGCNATDESQHITRCDRGRGKRAGSNAGSGRSGHAELRRLIPRDLAAIQVDGRVAELGPVPSGRKPGRWAGPLDRQTVATDVAARHVARATTPSTAGVTLDADAPASVRASRPASGRVAASGRNWPG